MDKTDIDKTTDKWFGFSLFLMRFVGIWPFPGLREHKWVLYLHYLNLFINGVCFILFYSSQIGYIIKNSEAENILRTLPLMLAYFEAFIRDSVIVSKREKFEELVCILDRNYEGTLHDEDSRPIWKTAFRLARVYRILFFWCISTGTYMYWVFPIVDMLGTESNNDYSTKPIPYQLYVPFDMNSTVAYSAVYLTECLLMVKLTSSFIAADTLVITLMIHTAGQLKVLNMLFRKLEITAKKNMSLKNVNNMITKTGGNDHMQKWRKDSKRFSVIHDTEAFNLYNSYDTLLEKPLNNTKLQAEENDNNSHMSRSPAVISSLSQQNASLWEKLSNDILNKSDSEENKKEVNDEMEKCFRDCIQIHQSIISFVAGLQELIGFIMLFQFLTNSLVMCLTLYKGISSSELTVTSAIKFLMFFFNILLEIFLICKCGEDIMTESSRIVESVYECDWYKTSEKFKKDCVILMARAQKPLNIKAGRVYVISLETFKTFVNAAYSFYTLVRQVNTETL